MAVLATAFFAKPFKISLFLPVSFIVAGFYVFYICNFCIFGRIATEYDPAVNSHTLTKLNWDMPPLCVAGMYWAGALSSLLLSPQSQIWDVWADQLVHLTCRGSQAQIGPSHFIYYLECEACQSIRQPATMIPTHLTDMHFSYQIYHQTTPSAHPPCLQLLGISAGVKWLDCNPHIPHPVHPDSAHKI